MNDFVLIINGATRINGNTDILIEKIIAGANDAGLNPVSIEVRHQNISECIGCYSCQEESRCSLQDDMTEIHDHIKKQI